MSEGDLESCGVDHPLLALLALDDAAALAVAYVLDDEPSLTRWWQEENVFRSECGIGAVRLTVIGIHLYAEIAVCVVVFPRPFHCGPEIEPCAVVLLPGRVIGAVVLLRTVEFHVRRAPFRVGSACETGDRFHGRCHCGARERNRCQEEQSASDQCDVFFHRRGV